MEQRNDMLWALLMLGMTIAMLAIATPTVNAQDWDMLSGDFKMLLGENRRSLETLRRGLEESKMSLIESRVLLVELQDQNLWLQSINTEIDQMYNETMLENAVLKDQVTSLQLRAGRLLVSTVVCGAILSVVVIVLIGLFCVKKFMGGGVV